MPITRLTLWLAVGILMALVAWGASLSLRREPFHDGSGRDETGPGIGVMASLAAFLVILGVKLWSIDRFAYGSPFFDQWFEGVGIYREWHLGRLEWQVLALPAGAHRIFFTRLSALALFDLNQQWDNRLQTVVSAVVHAATMTLVLVVVARGRPRRQRVACWVAIIALTAFPYARENVVWGYQSQFYFLIALTVLAARLLTREPARQPGFWLGLAAALGALYSLGSGPLCAIAVLLALLVDAVLDRRRLRQTWPAILGCAAIAVLGLALRYRGENLDQARGLRDFLVTTGRTWAYPFVRNSRYWPLIWAPFVAWLFHKFRRREPATAVQRFVLALGFFALLHGPAIGLARGGGGVSPATRYFDLLGLGLLVNLLAALDLASLTGVRRRLPVLALTGAYWALAGWGLWQLYPEIAPPTKIDVAMARYLRTLDPGSFPDKQSVPYPSLPDMLRDLSDEYLRSIMPAKIRAPVALRADDPGHTAFEQRPDRAGEEVGPAMPLISSRWKFETGRGGPLRSQELPENGLPWLRFWFTGYFDPRSHSVVIESREGVVPVRPDRQPGFGWEVVTVRRPAGPFRIVARDDRWDRWFGFTPPIEIGPLSLRSEQLLSSWPAILGAGLLLAVVAFNAGAGGRRTRRWWRRLFSRGNGESRRAEARATRSGRRGEATSGG